MIPNFKSLHARQQEEMGVEGALQLLEAGRAWNLAPVLRAGGSIIFPHTTLGVCGHQIAAAVHACFESGAPRVLALGVLHARTEELRAARARVDAGGDPGCEPARGIQGPGVPGRDDWRDEFSLLHFGFLWECERQRRGVDGPELVTRYPYLAAGRPQALPGVAELEEVARDAVVIATMDAFHHGIGYGTPPEDARYPEAGGCELARQQVARGLEILRAGDYPSFERHCSATKSDGRDAGQVLRHLKGPQQATILDLVADDMTGPYQKPAPTWVAGALIEMREE